MILALTAGIIVLKSAGHIAASLTLYWSARLGVLLAGRSELAFVIFAMSGIRSSLGPALVTQLTAAVALTLGLTGRSPLPVGR